MMQPTLSVEVVPGKHARLHTKTNFLTVQLSDPDKENCTSKKKKWPIAVQLASSGRKAVCISVVHADTGERVEHCKLVNAASGDPFGSVFLFDEPSMRVPNIVKQLKLAFVAGEKMVLGAKYKYQLIAEICALSPNQA